MTKTKQKENKEIEKERAAILLASASHFGSTIAMGYVNAEKGKKTATNARKVPK